MDRFIFTPFNLRPSVFICGFNCIVTGLLVNLGRPGVRRFIRGGARTCAGRKNRDLILLRGAISPPNFSRVKLSVKSDYAARAVLGLARHWPDGGARRVEELAAEQGVPSNYLVQILIELKANRIVKSQRGKEGGYQLARAPADISLGDLLRAIHGQVFDSPAISDPQCPSELRAAWKKLQKALENTADNITFQQLLDESADKEKMYYI
jgi:Rrf2 family transcriptional regulator, cysteine metabolism repressor